MPPSSGFTSLTNSIKELNSSIERLIGPKRGSKNDDPLEGTLAGGKSLNELLADQNDALKELTKTLSTASKKQEQGLIDHAKKLEGLGIIMNAVGQGLQQFTKYNITLPYQLMGGQFGAVAQPALQREKEAGTLLSSLAAMASLAIPGIGSLGAVGIAAAGQFGLNQIIGRKFFQDTAIETATKQSIAQMSQSGLMDFREAARFSFGVERFNIAGTAVGGQSANQAMFDLAKVGVSGPRTIEIFAEALKVGGAKGLKEVDWEKVSRATAAGIYGDAATVSISTALGARAGFNQEALMAALRRTGFGLDTQAQLAMSLGTRAYLAPGAAQNLFSMATNMPMARLSPQMAAQFISETAGRTGAVAAGGNEAQEMLLFQQFQLANPGASYLDFIEASRNKEFDQRWLKMIRSGTAGFAAGGQIGGIMGTALGFFGRPVEAGRAAAQFASKGLDDIMKGGKEATLARGEVSTIQQSNITNMAIALKFQEEWGKKLESTNEDLMRIATSTKNFSDMLKGLEVIMNRLSESVIGAEIRKITTERAPQEIPGMAG